MSVVARSSSPQASSILDPAPAARAGSTAGSSSIKWLLIALIPLTLIYLAMLNPYWVPSGDGEVYTCIARSLVLGEGLKFNGFKAAIAPPGWPLVLSWAMRICPEFWFLKLITTGSMLLSFIPAFYVVRRFVSGPMAASVILLTGTLSSLYPLTFWMHTEAFFCLLGFTAVLIAFRVREQRAAFWEAPLMLALLAAGAFTRWPGVLHLVLIVPILFSGDGAPWKRGSRWLLAALVIGLSIATFSATRSYLSLTPQEKRQAVAAGSTADVDVEDTPVVAITSTTLPTTAPTTEPTTDVVAELPNTGNDDIVPGVMDIQGSSDRSAASEVFYRVGSSGRWFAWLLWQPTRFGQSIDTIDVSAVVGGWTAIIVLIMTLWSGLLRREYFWVGLAIYTGGLCLLWPNPNARYFVPVAPFIIVGIFRGLADLATWLNANRTRPHRLPPTLLWLFVIATLAVNLPLLAVDISVFRSKDFYARYEAGANKELIAVAQYINDNPPPPGTTVTISELYDNMGRQRWSKYGMRALHLLTNRPVIGIERKRTLKDRPTSNDVRRWLRREEISAHYSVYQSAWNPWRLWHFRLSPNLQQRLTGKRPPNETGGWELFNRYNARYIRVQSVPPSEGPKRVPGL